LLPSLRRPVALVWAVVIVLGLAGFFVLSSVAPGAADSFIKRVDIASRIFSALMDGAVIAPRGSIGARWVRFMSGIEALAANPTFGVGLGQFPHWVENATFSNLPSDDRYGSLHGGYIQVIAQTGIVGTVTFVALWIGVIRELISGIATSDGEDHTLALVGTCVVVFMLVGWSHSFGMIHTVRWGMIGLFYGFVTTGG
jgi:O-antigen ligase